MTVSPQRGFTVRDRDAFSLAASDVCGHLLAWIFNTENSRDQIDAIKLRKLLASVLKQKWRRIQCKGRMAPSGVLICVPSVGRLSTRLAGSYPVLLRRDRNGYGGRDRQVVLELATLYRQTTALRGVRV